METVIYKPTTENIKHCARLLLEGETVAFPTETVYGLGANALDESAVKKIYEAKGRPSDNPLIVHIADIKRLSEFAMEIPDMAYELLNAFTPGPLTIVLKKKPIVPDIVTGGLDTVGVRFPAHSTAVKLLRAAGVPVCAPSANLSTKPSPTCAKHVFDDMNGRIPAILDGGSCEVGIESTIIDLSGKTPRLLRKGGIPSELIIPITGELETVEGGTVALCPGMKYKHYAPNAEVFFSAYYNGMERTIIETYDRMTAEGKNPIILCLGSRLKLYGERTAIDVGTNYADYARNAFSALRAADERGYDTVIAEGVDSKGVGEGLINRLINASGGRVI